MTRGFIFDFNGTLFWDTELHDQAWMIFSEKYGLNITKEYLRDHLHGKVNREIFRLIWGSRISLEKANALSAEKEQIYRDIVYALKTKPGFAPGAVGMLDKLREKEIPIAIATSSSKDNVDFYKEIFELNKWFPDDLIIYDDGSFDGKPAPDIFLITAKKLGLNPTACTVFEDSLNGIKAARAAGIGKIFLLTSGNHLAWDHSDPDIEMMEDFTVIPKAMEQML